MILPPPMPAEADSNNATEITAPPMTSLLDKSKSSIVISIIKDLLKRRE